MTDNEKMASANPSDYTEDSFETLSWNMHIRKRSGMYIGKLGDGSSPDDGIYVLFKEIVDNATNEANGVKTAAMQYLDDMLANLENLMTTTLSTTTTHYESFYNAINSYNETVKANRAELHPVEVEKMLKEAEGEDEELAVEQLIEAISNMK